MPNMNPAAEWFKSQKTVCPALPGAIKKVEDMALPLRKLPSIYGASTYPRETIREHEQAIGSSAK